jgi:hypothetical protein
MEFLKNNPSFFNEKLFEALFDVSRDLPGLGAEIFVNVRLKR